MAPNFTMLMFSDKIINSRARLASLSNDSTHQNTRFQWSVLKSPWNPTLQLHYTFHSTIENFSACCNTSRGIKLSASQTSRFRAACSLAITNMLREVSMPMPLAERKKCFDGAEVNSRCSTGFRPAFWCPHAWSLRTDPY